MPVRVVLWDADGVLQHTPPGWREELTALGGPDFADAVLEAEKPPLRGEGSFRTALAHLLAERGLAADPDSVLALWDRLQIDIDALDLVDSVRAQGVSSFLATNQQDYRVAIMRGLPEYAGRFDGEFFSSELGVAKPDPEFFERVLARVGVPAGDVLFIDDNPANVESAKVLGLRIVLHDSTTGAPGLRRALVAHGVLAG